VKNAAGIELNDAEVRLVECYRSLVSLLTEHRDQLAPYQERNALKAVASLWQIMNNLEMEPGQLYSIGA
jgi:hypothetical protein